MEVKMVADRGNASDLDALRTLPVPLAVWHESRFSARTDPLVALSTTRARIESGRPLPDGAVVYVDFGDAAGAIDAVVAAHDDSGFVIDFITVDDHAKDTIARTLAPYVTAPPVTVSRTATASVALAGIGLAPAPSAPAALVADSSGAAFDDAAPFAVDDARPTADPFAGLDEARPAPFAGAKVGFADTRPAADPFAGLDEARPAAGANRAEVDDGDVAPFVADVPPAADPFAGLDAARPAAGADATAADPFAGLVDARPAASAGLVDAPAANLDASAAVVVGEAAAAAVAAAPSASLAVVATDPFADLDVIEGTASPAGAAPVALARTETDDLIARGDPAVPATPTSTPSPATTERRRTFPLGVPAFAPVDAPEPDVPSVPAFSAPPTPAVPLSPTPAIGSVVAPPVTETQELVRLPAALAAAAAEMAAGAPLVPATTAPRTDPLVARTPAPTRTDPLVPTPSAPPRTQTPLFTAEAASRPPLRAAHLDINFGDESAPSGNTQRWPVAVVADPARASDAIALPSTTSVAPPRPTPRAPTPRPSPAVRAQAEAPAPTQASTSTPTTLVPTPASTTLVPTTAREPSIDETLRWPAARVASAPAGEAIALPTPTVSPRDPRSPFSLPTTTVPQESPAPPAAASASLDDPFVVVDVAARPPPSALEPTSPWPVARAVMATSDETVPLPGAAPVDVKPVVAPVAAADALDVAVASGGFEISFDDAFAPVDVKAVGPGVHADVDDADDVHEVIRGVAPVGDLDAGFDVEFTDPGRVPPSDLADITAPVRAHVVDRALERSDQAAQTQPVSLDAIDRALSRAERAEAGRPAGPRADVPPSTLAEVTMPRRTPPPRPLPAPDADSAVVEVDFSEFKDVIAFRAGHGGENVAGPDDDLPSDDLMPTREFQLRRVSAPAAPSQNPFGDVPSSSPPVPFFTRAKAPEPAVAAPPSTSEPDQWVVAAPAAVAFSAAPAAAAGAVDVDLEDLPVVGGALPDDSDDLPVVTGDAFADGIEIDAVDAVDAEDWTIGPPTAPGRAKAPGGTNESER